MSSKPSYPQLLYAKLCQILEDPLVRLHDLHLGFQPTTSQGYLKQQS